MPRPTALLVLLLLSLAAAGEIQGRNRGFDNDLKRARRAGIPGISIAVVDQQTVIWSKGFGHCDLAKTKPATAETVYRVGSVSKLFTDIAVMQLVEQGKLDLDAPVDEVPARLQADRTRPASRSRCGS